MRAWRVCMWVCMRVYMCSVYNYTTLPCSVCVCSMQYLMIVYRRVCVCVCTWVRDHAQFRKHTHGKKKTAHDCPQIILFAISPLVNITGPQQKPQGKRVCACMCVCVWASITCLDHVYATKRAQTQWRHSLQSSYLHYSAGPALAATTKNTKQSHKYVYESFGVFCLLYFCMFGLFVQCIFYRFRLCICIVK